MNLTIRIDHSKGPFFLGDVVYGHVLVDVIGTEPVSYKTLEAKLEWRLRGKKVNHSSLISHVSILGEDASLSPGHHEIPFELKAEGGSTGPSYKGELFESGWVVLFTLEDTSGQRHEAKAVVKITPDPLGKAKEVLEQPFEFSGGISAESDEWFWFFIGSVIITFLCFILEVLWRDAEILFVIGGIFAFMSVIFYIFSSSSDDLEKGLGDVRWTTSTRLFKAGEEGTLGAIFHPTKPYKFRRVEATFVKVEQCKHVSIVTLSPRDLYNSDRFPHETYVIAKDLELEADVEKCITTSFPFDERPPPATCVIHSHGEEVAWVEWKLVYKFVLDDGSVHEEETAIAVSPLFDQVSEPTQSW